MAANPPILMGVMAASAPPQIITSASPRWISRIEILDLAGDTATELGGVEGGNRTNTALSAPDSLPDRLSADSNRSQHADSGDYYSALQEGSVNLAFGLLLFGLNISDRVFNSG